jgi:hypothetical protein
VCGQQISEGVGVPVESLKLILGVVKANGERRSRNSGLIVYVAPERLAGYRYHEYWMVE